MIATLKSNARAKNNGVEKVFETSTTGKSCYNSFVKKQESYFSHGRWGGKGDSLFNTDGVGYEYLGGKP